MPKLTTKLLPGRRQTHGGYSFLATGKLPEHRRYIESYLTAARMNLIQDLGPTEADLTTAQIIIIDRLICKLGIVRCIEEFVRDDGLFQGKRLVPSLRDSYLAYNNSVRLDLQALGIDKKKAGEVLDLGRYVEEKYGKAKESARGEGEEEDREKE